MHVKICIFDHKANNYFKSKLSNKELMSAQSSLLIPMILLFFMSNLDDNNDVIPTRNSYFVLQEGLTKVLCHVYDNADN